MRMDYFIILIQLFLFFVIAFLIHNKNNFDIFKNLVFQLLFLFLIIIIGFVWDYSIAILCLTIFIIILIKITSTNTCTNTCTNKKIIENFPLFENIQYIEKETSNNNILDHIIPYTNLYYL